MVGVPPFVTLLRLSGEIERSTFGPPRHVKTTILELSQPEAVRGSYEERDGARGLSYHQQQNMWKVPHKLYPSLFQERSSDHRIMKIRGPARSEGTTRRPNALCFLLCMPPTSRRGDCPGPFLTTCDTYPPEYLSFCFWTAPPLLGMLVWSCSGSWVS